ncbi:NAD-dependent protein deacetylase [Lachnellula arida]|uniref:NAD-dependent protein deacetylase n=1 Tax=Lachnellula arida TaxID=1316785 RepID=A0A8T9BD69_9HELO|nr:NAD-dependent protein deacetylase [Lachnellula arida]
MDAAAVSQIGLVTAPYDNVDTSDDESETTPDALPGLPRVSGVNGNGNGNGLNGSVQIEILEASDDGSLDGSEDDEEWDIESVFEETLGEIDDQYLFQGDPNSCTYDEAIQYRNDLRTFGPEKFCSRTIEAGTITAKKLLTAFNLRPPPDMEGLPDDAYYQLLSVGISRELSKRIKLPLFNTIDDAVNLLKGSRNIIVLTGAGISTSLGIPDFRSKDIGLYSKLQHLGLSDPQEVFDISLFREDPTYFYSVAKDIIPEGDRFTPTHKFIHMLQQKGKLLTNYTQNIDNLENIAGILPEKLIQCHGSFATASCIQCKYQVDGTVIFPDIRANRIPRCDKCIALLRAQKGANGMKRKRSANGQEKKRRRFDSNSDSEEEEDYDIPEAGVMKPDITFFGEPLPTRFSERLTTHDKDLVDLVIVMGTSLKVAPVSDVVPYLPSHIPQIYISRDPVSHVNFDIDLLGDCDIVVAELCRRAGWDLNHEMVPKDQKADIKLQDGFTSRYRFSVQT